MSTSGSELIISCESNLRDFNSLSTSSNEGLEYFKRSVFKLFEDVPFIKRLLKTFPPDSRAILTLFLGDKDVKVTSPSLFLLFDNLMYLFIRTLQN